MSGINRKAGARRGPYWTRKRQQVLDEITSAVERGEPVPMLATLARRCGLYDYRDARRIRDDLRKMGRLAT